MTVTKGNGLKKHDAKQQENADPTFQKLSEEEIRPEKLRAGQEAAFARDVLRLQSRKDEFVEVHCPACNSASATFALSKYDMHYQQCSSCNTLYMSPRPSPEIMADYYTNSENYQYWSKYIFPATEATRREKLHTIRLKRIQDYCEQYSVPQGMLLEVGPGFGTFSALAQESNTFKRVTAVEPTPELAEACRERGVDVIEKRFEDLGNSLPPVDVLVAFEVIEHLFEPLLFVQKASKIVRPGGLLILTCPNGLGFEVQVLRELSPSIDPEHVNLFNPDAISRMVEQNGFEVLDVATPGKLDAEYVHDAAIKDTIDLSKQLFLKQLLLDEWDKLCLPFQQFLAENQLSSHMWLVAKNHGAY